jgi:mannose-6-phosphate isomerase class I
MRSIDWSAGPVHPATPQLLSSPCAGAAGETLVRCSHFRLDRHRILSELPVPYAGRMSIWILLDGAAELRSSEGGYRRQFRLGQTVLIPATSGPLTWVASGGAPATALAVILPD